MALDPTEDNLARGVGGYIRIGRPAYIGGHQQNVVIDGFDKTARANNERRHVRVGRAAYLRGRRAAQEVLTPRLAEDGTPRLTEDGTERLAVELV